MRYFVFIFSILLLFSTTVFADEAVFCPQATGDTDFEISFNEDSVDESKEDYFPYQILHYLNTTGSSEGLQEAIANSVDEDSPLLWLKSNIVEADFTGDTIPDVLVEYTVSYGGGFNTQFNLYRCNEDHFIFLDNWNTGGWMNGEDESPTKTELAIDLNNNQRRDIVVRMDTIEGMKYHQQIFILEWTGSELENIFQIGPQYGSYGKIDLVDLDNNPATAELNIGSYYAYEEETAMAYIEMHTYRSTMMTYVWDGNNFAFQCEYFSDAPTQRLFILHSAETLRACGYYERAESYYRQLWNRWDDSLLNWGGDPGMGASLYVSELEQEIDEASKEEIYYHAFAGYRLVQIYSHQGEIWRAKDDIQVLQENYQKGDHGYSYAAMAIAYWNSYQETGDFEQACSAAAIAFLQANESGDNPPMEYYEESYGNGETYQFGFYFANGRHYGANPDNVFAVPTDIDGMVSTTICL